HQKGPAKDVQGRIQERHGPSSSFPGLSSRAFPRNLPCCFALYPRFPSPSQQPVVLTLLPASWSELAPSRVPVSSGGLAAPTTGNEHADGNTQRKYRKSVK